MEESYTKTAGYVTQLIEHSGHYHMLNYVAFALGLHSLQKLIL